MKITVGISNRHVHLTKDTYEYLFGEKDLQSKRKLNQIGEFASTDVVDIAYKDRIIRDVRIVGPFRNHNQVELLHSDAEYLGLALPVRRSGDLEDTPSIDLLANGKTCKVDGVIRAERHVHVPTDRENSLGLHERDVVKIVTPTKEFTANVKVSANGYFELHIDKDEASEYGLSNGDEVEWVICGK